MASVGECSLARPNSMVDKPVIVRVKRKASQSLLDAFWLEINERPLKRPLLDFEKLSISDSSGQVEELKSRKVLVQHVETISSSQATFDIVQSFVPISADAPERKANIEERKHTFRKENKQGQLLSKSRQKQEALAKTARFEQIWRRRTGNEEAVHDMCHFYDVVRVDVEERYKTVQVQEDMSLEDHKLLSSYLPLLREFIPIAAEDIESDIQNYVSKKASTDVYVYDFYAVKNDMIICDEDALNPLPLVRVEDEDFYDGPDESEYQSDDSNAENNPLNDYPEEISDEEEDDGSEDSDNDSEEHESNNFSDKSSEPKDLGHSSLSDDVDLFDEAEIYDDVFDGYDDDYDAYDGEDWGLSYQ